MNKQIKVDLVFNANTQSAKQQIKSLQDTLNQAAYAGSSGQLGITPQIQKATQDALALKVALQNATNVNTGKLNLNKFQQQMKSSGMSAQSLAASLSQLGPQGAQAFNQLTRAIATSERKVFSLSGGLKSLAGTFFNTVKWSLASSAIQGITSAISNTISYAKELDTSLNNIRIVTGKGANEMARFAREANNMAKQLSTTTKAYTDASLIYFQQGLDKAAVKERTDTTIKLANVVGRSASEVSEWMTAIWNNFDDGSKSLEYYADVITKLGAATASSADEIAGGLEKFASIAETVGLSYEYAASALATITAQTRQSEDVVGTALKTIFSRMENLSLGETLDDGTTLGKYSDALKTVGVNIKDANGNLKDMDIILQQTGERWATLDRASQVALAQSVAGIRQYAQFMSLMDNWDIMEKNVEMSKQSTGELEAQNAIYEQSAAAAKKRSQAAAEEIKASLFGGDDLKDFYDGMAKVYGFVGDLVDAFGGLKGILIIVSGLLMKMVAPKIMTGLKQIPTYLQATFTPNRYAKKQEAYAQQFQDANKLNFGATTQSGKAKQDQLTMNQSYTNKMFQYDKLLSENDKQRLDFQKQLLDTQYEQYIKKTEELEKIQEENSRLQEQLGIEEKITENLTKQKGLEQAKTDAKKIMGNIKINADEKAKFDVAKAEQDKLNSVIKNSGAITPQVRADYIAQTQANITSMGGTPERQSKVMGALNTYQADGDFSKLEMALNDFMNSVGTKVSNGLEKAIKEAVDAATSAAQQELKELKNYDSTIKEKKANNLKGLEKAEEELKNKKPTNFTDKDQEKLNELNTARSKGKLNDEDEQKRKELNTKKQDAKKYKEIKDEVKSRTKAEKDYNAQLAKNEKKRKEILGTIQKTDKEIKQSAGKIKDEANANAQSAKEREKLLNAQKKLEESIGKTAKIQANFGSIVGGLASLTMGFSMATNAANGFFEEMKNGDLTLSEGISYISSYLMAILTMSGPIMNLIGILQKKRLAALEAAAGDLIEKETTKKKNKETEKNIILTEVEGKVEKKNADESIKNAGKEVVANEVENKSNKKNIAFNLGKWLSKGPWGWAIAGVALAGILALGLPIVGGIVGSGKKSGEEKEEERQENIEKNKEKISDFNETKEATKNIGELTKSLEDLRAAGESTVETVKQLSEELPKIVDEFRSLEGKYGIELASDKLNELVKYYKETGVGLERINALIDEGNTKLTEQNFIAAQSNVADANASFKYQLKAGDGWENEETNTYNRQLMMNPHNSTIAAIMEGAFEGFSIDSKGHVQFNIEDSENYIKYYNAVVEAKQKLELAGQTDTKTYERVRAEWEELAEKYQLVVDSQNTLFLNAESKFIGGEGVSGEDTDLLGKFFGQQGINSLQGYMTQRDSLIEWLQEQYKGLDEEGAKKLLSSSNIFGQWESASKIFDSNSVEMQQFTGHGGVIEQAQEWYDSLPDNLKKFTIGVNWEFVNDEADFQREIKKLREESEIAANRLEAENLGVDSKTFDTYVEVLIETNEALEGNKRIASEVATANIRINKSLEKLSDSFGEAYSKISRSTTGTYEYAEGIATLRKSLSEMFGVDVNTDFIEENLSDIQKLAEYGDGQAFEDLQAKAAQGYVDNIKVQSEAIFAGQEKYEQSTDLIRSSLSSFVEELSIADASVGNVFDQVSSENLAVLQKALASGQLSVEQFQKAVNAAGYELGDIEWKTIDGPTTTRKVTTVIDGEDQDTITYKEQSQIAIPVLNGASIDIDSDAPKAEFVRTVDSTSINTSDFAKNKANKAKQFKNMREEVERYHEIENAIEGINRELDKMSQLADRAYGKNKIKLLDQQIQKTEELKQKTAEYLEEIKKNESKDLENFKNAYGAVGGGALNFNEDGSVANWTEVRNNAINWYERQGGESNEIAKEAYEEFERYANQYDETIEEKIAKGERLVELGYEAQNLAYEKIEYKMELNVELNEREIEKIERAIQQLGDDIFTRAEIATLHLKAFDIDGKGTNLYQKQQDVLAESYKELNVAKEAGTISEEEYVEGLKAVESQMYDNIDAILELKETMGSYYSDTLDAGQEKYQTYFDFMSHGADVLEHYSSILDIAGEEENYWKKGDILEGITEVRKNQLDSNIKYYETLKKQTEQQMLDVEKAEKDLEQAKASDDQDKIKAAQDALKIQEGELQATLTMQNEAEEAMLSSAEEYAQSLRDIYENEIAKARKELELAMTNGQGFDYINSNMERIRASTEEWYDDTNKIYETNKMIRNIQGEIDKTTNLAAKQKLKTFEEQTKQLQNQQKLSKTEMDIQQKRYDLLLAEIALEEAQNAKNQVRLQRDSEGNFGYVYTANQANVSAAQQKVDDAQNTLYNTGLEGQQKYTELYYQTLQEYYDALGELEDRRSTMTAEEYERQLNELNIFYNNMLSDYIYLGQVSFLAEDTRLSNEFKDGWWKTYDEIITNADGNLEDMANSWLTFTEKAGGYKDTFNSKITSGDKLFFGNLLGNFVKHQNDIAQPQATYQQGWSGVFTGIDSSAETLRTNLVGTDGKGGYVYTMKSSYEDFGERLEEVNEALGISLTGGENVGLYGNANKAGQGLDELYKKSNHLIDEKGGLKSLQKATQDVKNESGYWRDKLLGSEGKKGLIDLLGEEYTKVNNLTTEFTNQLPGLQSIVSEYAKWAKEIDKVIKGLDQLDGNEDDDDVPQENENPDDGIVDDTSDGGTNFTPGEETTSSHTFNKSFVDATGKRIVSTTNKNTSETEYYYESDLEHSGTKTGDSVILKDGVNNITVRDISWKGENKAGEDGRSYFLGSDGLWYNPQQFINSGKQVIGQGETDIGTFQKQENYLLLSTASLNTKNADNIAVYDENGDYIKTGRYINDDKLAILQKNQIIGYKQTADGDRLYKLKEPFVYHSYNTYSSVSGEKGDTPKVTGTKYERTYYLNETDLSQLLGWNINDLRLVYLPSFDTGGYTGAWGPEGRWAMLHQKEIVLNAHDTENFLSAIEILRGITQAIDLQAMSYNGLINNYLPYLQNTNTNTLQQDVTIHAEFPNATDHNEIQLAIEGLVNSAAQRANRK